jgi:hypothetical protein
VELEWIGLPDTGGADIAASAGTLRQRSATRWWWTAPAAAGIYRVELVRSVVGESMLFNMFVLVAGTELKGGHINNYPIGAYPAPVLQRSRVLSAPRGFIEVTRENEEMLLSPHFRLRQFLCKQEADYPKYVVLSEKLFIKLELILEGVHSQGYRCDTLEIMSGYRTPVYNRAIGNVKYSRHQWGDAADIFIDENPRDGVMDDLNGDGRSDHRDAAVLQRIVDELQRGSAQGKLAGGPARYPSNRAHGPFVHLDVRGYLARW